MGNTIRIERVRSLYDFRTDGLKMEQLSEEIMNLDGICIMSIINIMSLIILVLTLKLLVDVHAIRIFARDDKQILQLITKENSRIMVDTLQALEKLIKTCN